MMADFSLLEKIPPPEDESELLARAQAIAGLSLGQLASQWQIPVPSTLKRDKGWQGQLLEFALGADAGCLPVPDFRSLGIELKTLPLSPEGRPYESTFVATVPLLNASAIQWQQSEVWQKLKRILWIPLIYHKNTTIADRRIGMPLLWSPSVQEQQILHQDWQELMTMVTQGELEQITARLGEYLQIRPKGANSRALCWGIDRNGEKIRTLPRGFYLRPRFTRQLLSQYFIT